MTAHHPLYAFFQAPQPVIFDLTIEMQFNGSQPNTYHVPLAAAQAYQDGQFVGDTRRGGSCNFETYTLTPHCNGTHTECVGHLTDDRVAVWQLVPLLPVPAALITVTPVPATTRSDTYSVAFAATDMIITGEALAQAFDQSNIDFPHTEAVIIRTLPNTPDKKQRDYMQTPPAFFSIQAMEYLHKHNVTHLVTDLPSVDRLFDEGKLAAHRIFWQLASGHSLKEAQAPHRTITEMVFIDNHIPDGKYFVQLQVPVWAADAAPARVLLWQI
jgi:kynurenine formamidase